MDHPEDSESEILERYSHRLRRLRCIAELHFESEALAAAHHQQIELGTLVSSPEVCLARGGEREDLLDNEAFPRTAPLRVAQQTVCRREVEQSVKQPGGLHVHLGRFDLALADVLEPRLKL